MPRHDAPVSNGMMKMDGRESNSIGLTDPALPPAERKPWRFSRFPILAWWPPPGDARLEDFEAYRDAGFTLHPTNIDTGILPALDKVRQAGLRSLVFRTHQNLASTPAKVDFESLGEREEVVGWITHDIPSGREAVAEAVREANLLMRKDPSCRALFNLLPPQAQHQPSTGEIIEAAVASGIPILSYYHYVIARDGSTHADAFYEGLEFFRQASVRHGVPFWAFALTLGHWDYRRPSQSDLRWQQFSNLAYGAKGLWYFTYWGPREWDDWDPVAIVDPEDGSPTELYDWVKEINETVLSEGTLLAGLVSLGVAHTNPSHAQEGFATGRSWIQEVEARDALVGFFRDASGLPYAWVVNKCHGMGQSARDAADIIRLRFSGDIGVVEPVLWPDGPGDLPSWDSGEAELELFGGTGVLLRARP